MLGEEVQQNAETQAQQPALLSPNYQFTAEERAVLSQCNSESFFQRSLPLMTIMGSTVYMGIKRGMLKPSAKYGAIPKVFGAAICGYFIGKISYQQKCMEKLMQLQNSPVGAALRQRFKQGVQTSPTEILTSPFSSFNSSNPDNDRPDNDNINLDTDRPTFAGLEDTYRPSLDGNSFDNRDIALDKMPTVSYDDLRKRNRESEAKVNPYKIPEVAAPPISRPPSSFPSEAKNKYGDVIN